MNITIENKGDKWTALLQGRLDTAASAAFEDGIKPLTEHADKEICIDCTELQYISMFGIETFFLPCAKKIAASNGKMVIKNLNSGLKDIFKMTGFTSLFDFE